VATGTFVSLLHGVGECRTGRLDRDLRSGLFDSGREVGAQLDIDVPVESYRSPQVHTGTLGSLAVSGDKLKAVLLKDETRNAGSHLPGSEN
jgi:hypothetical protein